MTNTAKSLEEMAAENAGQTATDSPASPSLPNDGAAEHVAPARRGRGRPPANAALQAQQIPEGSAPKVDKPKPRAKKNEADAASLGKQICGVHQMVAMMTGMPEMVIAPEEGEMLAKGIMGIADEYGLALDGKTGASLQLFACAAMVYAPRVFAIRNRLTQQKQLANQSQPAQVEGATQFDPSKVQVDPAALGALTGTSQ